MKTKDIKVGEDYAYIAYRSRSYTSAEPQRVKVLETGVTRQSVNWRTGDSHSNVRVQLYTDKGSVRTVRPQMIEEPWSEWVPKRDARDKRAREAKVNETAARDNRWAVMRSVDEVFKGLGIEGKTVRLYSEEAVESAHKAGFAVQADDRRRGGSAVLHGLDERGNVHLAAVALLARRYAAERT